ncbi:MAG: pyridoxamine 5'-phosphate oxidase family protein [Actinomycetes bacterium]
MTAQPYLEVLSSSECLDLLATTTVARMAYCTNGEAHVFPVNALLRGDEVVIRTTYGGKLAAAAHGATMTIEADDLDPETRTGWVVNVTGPSRVVEDDDEVALLELEPIEPWAPGDKPFFLGVAVDVVTGRRISLARGRGAPRGVDGLGRRAASTTGCVDDRLRRRQAERPARPVA